MIGSNGGYGHPGADGRHPHGQPHSPQVFQQPAYYDQPQYHSQAITPPPSLPEDTRSISRKRRRASPYLTGRSRIKRQTLPGANELHLAGYESDELTNGLGGQDGDEDEDEVNLGRQRAQAASGKRSGGRTQQNRRR